MATWDSVGPPSSKNVLFNFDADAQSFTVIDFLEKERATSRSNTPIAYFYCTRNATEPQRANPDEILRSILKQLSCSKLDCSIKKPVMKAYAERKEDADENNCDPEKLTATECVELILAILDYDPAVIVIDALDECDPARRHELLQALDRIIQISASLMKVFVSSRDDNDILCSLSESPNVYIHASDNDEDIQRFVRAEVNQAVKDRRLLCGDLSDSLKDHIICTLTRGAQGMFRWVSLQLENLCDIERIKHEGDVWHELGRLPTTLKESYDVIFSRVKTLGSQSWLIANSALKWLLSAQRPLNTAEFITAVAVDFNGQAIPLSKTQLLNICCNMVVVDAELDLFRFAHLSVQEYIEGHDEYIDINIHSHPLERFLALFVHDVALRTGNKNCFTAYATLHWPSHYQRIEHNQLSRTMEAKLTQFLFNDVGDAFAKWVSSAKQLNESMQWTNPKKVMLHEALCSPPTAQFIASYLGLFSILELLIASKNIDWNQRNENGHTSLHLAVLQDSEKTVRLLLKEEINLEVANNDTMTALSLAAANGRGRIVRLLVEAGASLGARDWNNRTALHCVAVTGDSDGHQAVVKTLLAHEADQSIEDRHGMTALWLAAKYGHKTVFKFLLNAGPYSNATDKTGLTALHIAVTLGHYHTVKILLYAGATIRSTNNELEHAPLRNGNGELDKLRTELHPNEFEVTPLHLAIFHGHYAIANLLLEKLGAADVEEFTEGETLHPADWMRVEEVATELLREKVTIELPTLYLDDIYNPKPTALEVAALVGQLAIMRILLDNDAKADARNPLKEKALMQAAGAKQDSATKLLLEYGANVNFKRDTDSQTALHLAAESGNLVLTKILLNNGAEVNLRNRDDQTPLYLAVINEHIETIKLLIESGANIDIRDSKSETALDHAVYCQNEEVMETLLRNGADIELKDSLGYSALHVEAVIGNRRSVKFLLKYDASVDARTASGETALHLTVQGAILNEDDNDYYTDEDSDYYTDEFSSILKLLLKYGADINAMNAKGETALEIAVFAGVVELEVLLLEAGADAEDIYRLTRLFS